MKKNDIFEGKCIGYTGDGLGIVKNEITFFVKGLLVDEVANIKIVSIKEKANIGFGIIDELIKPSIHRCNPKCSVASKCGGCTLQHMDYEEQCVIKKKRVYDCFKNIAQMEVSIDDVIKADDPFHYRNKVQVPVRYDDGLKMGFYQARTNNIIEFDNCCVQSDLSNEIITFCKKELVNYPWCKYLRHILIKHARVTNQIMLVLISNKDIEIDESFINDISERFEEIKSIILNINLKNNNVILGDEERVIFGSKSIQEESLRYTFNISSKSFFQINPYQTKKLYSKAIELADIKDNETVIDLYCGTGTIGIVASKHAKEVIGIEIIEDAIKDAKENAMINGINNISFYASDANKVKDIIGNEKVDVLFIDPPRKGCDKNTLDLIAEINPSRVVYVSCDPATLARDVKYLSETNYVVKKVIPLDMFPETAHVETVVLMSRVQK